MRITERPHGGSEKYWQNRWIQAPVDTGTLNLEKYPGKFAEKMVKMNEEPFLDAGCGVGRLVLHYHDLGLKITGMDYIKEAVNKIKNRRPDVDVMQADIMDTGFNDAQFGGVMAFGLYHSLPSGIDKALSETFRILKNGGTLVSSVRADNIQNLYIDFIEARKLPAKGERCFHKANYSEKEYRELLEEAGFIVKDIQFVENFPFLYKFKLFRHNDHKEFSEQKARSEGYRLSWTGQRLQNFLMHFFPRQFSNIMVAFATKPSNEASANSDLT